MPAETPALPHREPSIRRTANKSSQSVNWGNPPGESISPRRKSLSQNPLTSPSSAAASPAWPRPRNFAASIPRYPSLSSKPGVSAMARAAAPAASSSVKPPRATSPASATSWPRSRKFSSTLKVRCDLSLGGAWEIARQEVLTDSPIAWEDSGTLHVVNEDSRRFARPRKNGRRPRARRSSRRRADLRESPRGKSRLEIAGGNHFHARQSPRAENSLRHERALTRSGRLRRRASHAAPHTRRAHSARARKNARRHRAR